MQVNSLQNLQVLDLSELKKQKQLLQRQLREINHVIKQKTESDDGDSLVVKFEKAQDKTRKILARQQVENVDNRLEAMLCNSCSQAGHFQRFCPLKPDRLLHSSDSADGVAPEPLVPVASAPAPEAGCELLLQVRFTSPDRRIKGENASKLLNEASSLKQWVERAREVIRSGPFPDSDTRPAHIEVLRPKEKGTPEAEVLAASRSQELEGRHVALCLRTMNRALVIPTGRVSGYGETHVTVAYFRSGLGQDLFERLKTALESLRPE